ncbi:MAG: ArnT family glycosyltransferase [Chloroflexota bacterium]
MSSFTALVGTGVSRTDIVSAGALMVAGVITRLPFCSQTLYHWDSVNFALATVRFDVAEGQPHLPGYILYVALGWLGNLVTHDAQTTFVLLSVLFSGLSAGAVYCLGATMFSRPTGLAAGVLLLASPLFWFYGEVALPHVVDTFFVISGALLLYRVWQGQERLLLPASCLLAVAGGFRPQTELFLAPLWLLAAYRARPRTMLISGATVAILSALWLVPLLWLVGGIARYQQLAVGFSQAFRYWEPAEGLLRGNPSAFLAGGFKLVSYTAYGLGLAIAPPLVFAVAGRRHLGTVLGHRRSIFVATWIAPALLFYLLVHMGQQGLVLIFLPALLLVSAAAMDSLVAQLSSNRVGLALVGGALIFTAHATFFVVAPEHLSWPVHQKVLTWDTIRNRDQRCLSLTTTIRTMSPPERTILVGEDWRHVGYYLADYRLVRLPPGDIDEEMEVAPALSVSAAPRTPAGAVQMLSVGQNTTTVVLVDGDPEQLPRDGVARRVALASGPPIYIVELSPYEELRWVRGRLELHRPLDSAEDSAEQWKAARSANETP